MSLLFTLSRLNVVKFGHAFDFIKLNKISILVLMTFVFVDSDDRFVFIIFVDRSNNILLSVFSIFIKHNMVISEINEGISSNTGSFIIF